MEETLTIRLEKAAYSSINSLDFNNLDFGKYHTDHMYIVDYNEGRWHDHRIIPYQNISISPSTAALHYGQTVFEGFKAHRSKKSGDILIFRPEKHWERMNKSLERLCMPTIPKEMFMQGIMELAKIDNQWVPSAEGCSLYFRPFAFAMDAVIRVKPSENYYFIVFCSPVGAYFSGDLKVKVETAYVRSAEGGIGFSKAGGNYAASLLPAKKAAAEGYQQIMWTDAKEHRFIEETGASNVMFVIDNVLVTPALTSSILAGVTRDSILTLARDWGIQVEERRISIDEIVQAYENKTLQEAFGTGTAAVISPIHTIHYQGKNIAIPKSNSNSLSGRLLQALNDIKYGLAPDPYGWVVRV